MSVPVVENIEIYRGDYFEKIIESVMTAIAPLTLGQWSAAAQFRSTHDSAVAVDFGVVLSVEEAGTVLRAVISLTAAQTTAMPSSGYWDLEVTGPSLKPRTWIGGTALINKDVTR